MRKLFAFIAVFTAGLTAGSVIQIGIHELHSPNCPQEDMCTTDYRDGHFVIIEKESGTY